MSKIHRIKKDNNFVMLQKNVLNEPDLSWGAKGLHCCLMGLNSEGLNIDQIIAISKDSPNLTLKYIKELINIGYIEREIVKENGVNTTVYNIFEGTSLSRICFD